MKLTEQQRRTLRDIRIIAQWYQRQFEERKQDNTTLSPWILRYTLEHVHHINWRHIDKLVKAEYLEQRASDGGGYEIKILHDTINYEKETR